MSQTEVRQASLIEWQNAWESTDTATYFQSPQWHKTWAAAGQFGRMTPAAITVTLSTGMRVVVPMSVLPPRPWRRRTWLASPAGTYGGYLAVGPVSPEEHEEIISDVVRHRTNLCWLSNPFDSAGGAAVDGGMRTHVVPLVDADEDQLLRRMSKGHRSAVRQSRRQGIEVREARSIDDWHAYYDLYQMSLRRWGSAATSRYGWALFEQLRRLPRSEATLWLACARGRPIGGALCVYGPRHCGYWHGAADESMFHLRPINALVFEACRDAVRRGCAWFDLLPSGGHQGVAAFKRSFGADELAVETFAWGSPQRSLLRPDRLPRVRHRDRSRGAEGR